MQSSSLPVVEVEVPVLGAGLDVTSHVRDVPVMGSFSSSASPATTVSLFHLCSHPIAVRLTEAGDFLDQLVRRVHHLLSDSSL